MSVLGAGWRSPQSGLPCAHDGLGAIRDVQLGEDVRDVVPRRFRGDEQVLGDRGVSVAPGEQVEDLAFPFAQLREWRDRCWGGFGCEGCSGAVGGAWPYDELSMADCPARAGGLFAAGAL